MDHMNYRMRALRKALGVTQEEVGAIIGVSNVIVSLYERGLIDGSGYDNVIYQALYSIRERMVKKYGYWYNSYIDLKASVIEVEIWTDFEGHVPDSVIRTAKDCAVAFSEI